MTLAASRKSSHRKNRRKGSLRRPNNPMRKRMSKRRNEPIEATLHLEERFQGFRLQLCLILNVLLFLLRIYHIYNEIKQS